MSSMRLWVRVAVALAFADASIVVLALPQIVNQLGASISHVTWVIVAYNAALIVGSLAALVAGPRLVSTRGALVAGLLLFGAASLGCGLAGSLHVLLALRCVQGAGGALLLVASLPQFAQTAGDLRAGRGREGVLAGWSAAAAVGAAVGPALGGILTQAFDWRAIFLAQAPAAAIAAAAVLLSGRGEPVQPDQAAVQEERDPLGASANLSLALFSAGLIGALFLVTVLLIDVWLLTPLAAALVLSSLPIATVIVERFARGRSPAALGAAGAVLLAIGLATLAELSHKEVVPAVLALALCGVGLGLALPGLTAAALRSGGAATARAARTVAARDAGLVIGLLILTPIFVDDLNGAPARATGPAAAAVLGAPVPGAVKLNLAGGLLKVYKDTPQGSLPALGPVFAAAGAGSDAPTRARLSTLQRTIQSLIERAATRSFRRPLLFCVLFSLLVLPALALPWVRARRHRAA